jgi:hypothetical protein
MTYRRAHVGILLAWLVCSAGCGHSGNHGAKSDAGVDAAADAGIDGANVTVASVLGQPDVMTNLNVALGLSLPTQMSSGAGKLVVVDTSNNRVLIWKAIPTAAGTSPDLVLGPANLEIGLSVALPTSASTLHEPFGVWTDGTRLAVADTGNERVLVWSTFPTTSGQSADFVLGQPDFVSNNVNTGGLSGSSMSRPMAVLSDGTSLYVADAGNNRVLVWNTFPTAPVAADFALGQPSGATNLTSNAANNGGVSGASMSLPASLAVFADPIIVGVDDLYVCDYANNRVLVWSSLPVSPVAASFALGQPAATNLTSNTANNGGVSGSSMHGPSSITEANGKLFVTEYDNNRVLVWNTLPSAPSAASFVLGQPDMTSTTANNGGVSGSSMANPLGVVVAGGQLFVSDQTNSRILVWSTVPSTTAIASFALGQPPGAANLMTFNVNDGVAPSGTSMSAPSGVFSDGTRLFVVDRLDSRVLVWNTMPTADGQSADFALGQPAGAANLITTIHGTDGSGLYQPTAALVQNGMLFVADTQNNRVLVWKTVPAAPTPADFALGQPAGATNLTTIAANAGGVSGVTMNLPQGVASDGNRLFVADGNNARVLVWNTIPTSPVSADFALGQPGDSGNLTYSTLNNGGISGASMGYAFNVFVMAGALYVADPDNSRVLVWRTIPTSPMAADLALGQSNLTSAVSATTRTGLRGPIGLAGDGTRLYVADAEDNRVLVWSTPPTTSGQAADSVIGQADFTSRGADPAPMLGSSTFNFPEAVFADSQRLFVSDGDNDRVVVIPQ